MLRSETVGKALTVLGPIDEDMLGVTLPHEHLTIDQSSAYFAEPDNPVEYELAHRPVGPEILHWLKYNMTANLDNLRLDNEMIIQKELELFKLAGGSTVVEMSNEGINRNPEALVRISAATGINIVAGSGYYIYTSHPSGMSEKHEDEIAREIISDVIEGIDHSGVKAGVIGEIGCSWPLHPNEAKVVRAACKAQRVTKAPLSIHPGRSRKAATELIEIMAEAGAILSSTVISHVDIRVRTHQERVQLAKHGCYLEYDNFGWEGWQPLHPPWDPEIDIPTDIQRIKEISQLIEDGFLNQILISTDVAQKAHLVRYGGKGYNHILRYVVPAMLRAGISEDQVDAILVRNPKRLLCCKEM